MTKGRRVLSMDTTMKGVPMFRCLVRAECGITHYPILSSSSIDICDRLGLKRGEGGISLEEGFQEGGFDVLQLLEGAETGKGGGQW